MMYLIILLLNVFIKVIIASESTQVGKYLSTYRNGNRDQRPVKRSYSEESKELRGYYEQQYGRGTDASAVEEKVYTVSNPPYITHLISIVPENRTYFEKSENLLRMPKKYYEERTRKRKTFKKLPKRTVQKIIKKTKAKYRRNFNLATMQPTQVSNMIDKSFSANINNEATTQMNQRKKPKKNLKLMRYPMPFQKLPFHYRYRRDNERDVYILKDLDEIEFLSKEDGYDVVKAHVKKYW